MYSIVQHFMSIDEAFLYDYVHILILHVINSSICKYCLITGMHACFNTFYTLINIIFYAIP